MSVELPPVGHAISGATGAVIALFATYPLDVFKTRLQADTKHKLTWESMFAGLPSALCSAAVTNFAYFYYYFILVRNTKPSVSTGLILSAMAAALTQITTLPMQTVVTRQQTASDHEREGFLPTMKRVVRERGWQGLWAGFKPSMILAANPAITYGFYDPIKRILLNGENRSLHSWEVFIVGALSKTIATIITYPYIMAKVRLQFTRKNETVAAPMQSISAIMISAYRKNGVRGLYAVRTLTQGMQAQMLKAVLAQALLFTMKDGIDQQTLLLFTNKTSPACGLHRVVCFGSANNTG